MPNPKTSTFQGAQETNAGLTTIYSRPAMAKCPNCHEMKQPHRACPHCGLLQRPAGSRRQVTVRVFMPGFERA